MTLIETMAVAAGLGADAMGVSAAIGVRWHGRRHRLRLAWHMGLFQFLMPPLGWLLGRQVAELVTGVGKYVAAALLAGIGLKMLIEAARSGPGALAERAEEAAEHALSAHPRDPTRGWPLIGLAFATSLDALVAGFSFALHGETSIWGVSLVIGLTAAAMAMVGVAVGKRAGKAFGKWAEAAGAVVLIALAVTLLWL